MPARDRNYCFNHQDLPVERTCESCAERFCGHCLVTFQGRVLCGPCKNAQVRELDEAPKISALAVTAALLVARYRNLRGGNARLEPIAAEESKLILAALAEADWNRPQTRFDQLHPMNVFNQLGLTQKDGWQPQNVRTPQDYANAVRAWLRQVGKI